MAPFARELELLELEHERRRDDYLRLTSEIRRVLDEDPAFPVDRLALARSRYKRYNRLREKVEQLHADGIPVDSTNYAEHVVDLAGIRYVTLGIVDRQEVCRFVEDAHDRSVIRIVRQKVMDSFEQQAFGSAYPESAEVIEHPLGYTSVHYLIELPPGAVRHEELIGVRAELQVRTILEEAWAEVDHRYRYEIERTGQALPAYLSSAFTDLSHLLHAVARMQESLCAATEEYTAPVSAVSSVELAGADEASVEEGRGLRQLILRELGIDLAPVSISVLERDLKRRCHREVALDDITTWLAEYTESFLSRCEADGLRNLLEPASAGFEEVHMLLSYAALMGLGRAPEAQRFLRNDIRTYLG